MEKKKASAKIFSPEHPIQLPRDIDNILILITM